MASGLVKWDDRSRNSSGEDGILDHGSWMRKEKPGGNSEADVRRRIRKRERN